MSNYKPGIVNGDIIVKLESEIESLKKEILQRDSHAVELAKHNYALQKENEELHLLRTSDYNRIESLAEELQEVNNMLRELTYRSHARLPEDNEAAAWFDEGITPDFILSHWSLIEQIEGKL